MIVLHGKGDSFRPFKNFDQELKLFDFNFLLLNAPKKFLTGYSWYGDPPYIESGVLRTRLGMFVLLNDLEKQGWDPKNIFLLGFSQGCLISADFALNYPKTLGGFIGISGYFHFFSRWKNHIPPKAKKTPWLLTHGTRDDVLPIEDTRYGVKKLKAAGMKIDWSESDKKHVFKEYEYALIRKWIKSKNRIPL